MPKLNLNLPKKPVGRPRKDVIQYDKAEAFDLTKKLNAGNIAESMMSSLFKAPPKKRGRPAKTDLLKISPAKAAQVSSPAEPSIFKPSSVSQKKRLEPKAKTPSKESESLKSFQMKEREIINEIDKPISGGDFMTTVKNRYDKLFEFLADTHSSYWKDITLAVEDVLPEIKNKEIKDAIKSLNDQVIETKGEEPDLDYYKLKGVGYQDFKFIKNVLQAPYKFDISAESNGRYVKLLKYADIKTVRDYKKNGNIIGYLIGNMYEKKELEDQLRNIESKMDDNYEEYSSKQDIMDVFEKVRRERKLERDKTKKMEKKQM